MSYIGRVKESISQLANAITGGYSDEMLSARAHRTKNKPLITILDAVFGHAHCQTMHDWEFARKGQHPYYGEHK